MRLHITNGDSAGGTLAALFPDDRVLPWRDVLHDGPVPVTASTAGLSAVRAHFLAPWGHRGKEEILHSFRERDALLARATEFEETVLWFEHDLYDQLQLIQVLSELPARPPHHITLIQAHVYLGPLAAGALSELFPRRVPVTAAHFSDARNAWDAFRAPQPHGLPAVAAPAHPFLGPALLRFCEEYPAVADGLGRTERAILKACAAGVDDPRKLFTATQQHDEPRFLGDWSFFEILKGLQSGAAPLVSGDCTLTPKGAAVLAGRDDRIRGNGIDRWFGGVHLFGADAAWRWDATRRQFEPGQP